MRRRPDADSLPGGTACVNGTTGLRAADLEFTAGAGAGPAAGNARTDPAGNLVHPAIGATLLLSGGVDFLRRK